MNHVSDEKKESMTKVLAIFGFIAIVIFAVWIAIQIVRVVPSAFSSLASIADVVYNYRGEEKFEVATEKSVLNVGEAFVLSWTEARTEGTYSLSYACVDGVAVDIKKADGSIETIACNTPIDLGNATSIEMLVSSEKARFVDVAYTVTFTHTGKTEPKATNTNVITIVNASIPTSGLASTEGAPTPSTPEAQTPVDLGTPAPAKPVTPTYTAGTPTTVTKYVYITPVSDPKGTVDLQVTYLGVGTIKNGVFVKQTSIDIDEQGAVQFEVKNVGTKTAEEWSYEAELPASISYESKDQKALKPNERAVITLGFEGLSKDGSETISVEVDAEGDKKGSNNSFSQIVKITD